MRRPRVGAFPKGYFHELVAREGSTIEQWIDEAPALEIEGVELYPRFLESTDEKYLRSLLDHADAAGVELPMMCSSPDFVDPRPGAWGAAVEEMKRMVDVMVQLAPEPRWRSVRVLSGQRWPGVSEETAVSRVVEGINEVLDYAASMQVHVVMENHYKDGLWEYPEFAQSRRIFLDVVRRIDSTWFGVNFDPSNAVVAGDDPIQLLDDVLDRVVTMHASDRSLSPGYSLEDVAAHRGKGYPVGLVHGVTGQGLNDYDAILSRLAGRGFSGWISIEDGERGGAEGKQDIKESARFLRTCIERYWPAGEG